MDADDRREFVDLLSISWTDLDTGPLYLFSDGRVDGYFQLDRPSGERIRTVSHHIPPEVNGFRSSDRLGRIRKADHDIDSGDGRRWTVD